MTSRISDPPKGVRVKKPDRPDGRERELRVELGVRTIYADTRDNRAYDQAADSPFARVLGDEISRLMREGRLEEARERLETELAKTPREPSLLNLQTLLEMFDKPFGNYNRAKESGNTAMEVAVERDSRYYACMAINNMALVAHNEGHSEYSKAMYLAAHFIDRIAAQPIQNLAGWFARRGKLEEAQEWINRLLETYPDWRENDEMVIYFLKDESLHNLRTYKPFNDKVLSKIEGKHRNEGA